MFNNKNNEGTAKQILANLFSIQNIIIYIISFMISMVGFSSQSLMLSISPFAISFLASMLSNRKPIGFIYLYQFPFKSMYIGKILYFFLFRLFTIEVPETIET